VDRDARAAESADYETVPTINRRLKISRGLLPLPHKVRFAAMKTVTVAEAEKNFASVLRIVRGGEEVAVTRRKKTVAKIIPVSGKRRKYDWASTWAKVDKIFGAKPAPGKPASQIIIEGRR
jgi:prevent-host-death family protein